MPVRANAADLVTACRLVLLAVIVGVTLPASAAAQSSTDAAGRPPNILWISCEDISPNLGCYGDPYAKTPNIDRLAAEGVRFTRAFTHAGVCAVQRAGMITGVYPVSIGAHHMRSRIVPPPHVRCFPEYLRQRGYFCTNRWKTDYQFESPASAWDRQGEDHQDWRERAPGQPFFSVINFTLCHESKIRHPGEDHEAVLAEIGPLRHDPDRAGPHLPAYLPDTPATRLNWAWYADNISLLDKRVAEVLRRLEEDGLADETLVVFWSDHGMGMPRGKRWVYDTGTHVPVIMRWPGRLRPGTVRDDLVSLLDLPPTVLDAAGVTPPGHFDGRVLIGERTGPEPERLFFHRDRMDEAMELIRSVRDRRYRYLRNFEPEKPYAQGIDYMDLMPAMRDWRHAHAEGTLTPEQDRWFAEEKPIEELYDTQNDPYELANLAGDPEHAERLAAMRSELEAWQERVGDLGLVPEPLLMQEMHARHARLEASPPSVSRRSDGDQETLRLSCDLPGASIVWRYAGDAPHWRLYVDPIEVRPGEAVHAKSCRLGYTDSPEVVWRTGASSGG